MSTSLIVPPDAVSYDPQTGDYMVRLDDVLLGYAPSYSTGLRRFSQARADHDFRACPAPLDCADLAATFRADKAAAARLLAALTPNQLARQALAYASYVNELHDLDLAMDDIQANWRRGIALAQDVA